MSAEELESAHAPTRDRYWQESWYFNFADAHRGVFGLTRIGYRPATGRADGLWLAVVDGQPRLLYAPVAQRLRGRHVEVAPPRQLRTRALRYRCDEPLRRWSLSVDSARLKSDLVFTSSTPAYRYPPPQTHSAAAAAASDHYEQGGRVTGTIAHGGRTWTIDGYGQRDHSWGPRHWSGVGRWVWISGQFPTGWCFNVWRVGGDDDAFVCGFVGNREETIELVDARVDIVPGRGGAPMQATIALRQRDGGERHIVATAVGAFPLYKDGAAIDEFFVTMRCSDEQGVGVVEHLQRMPLRHAPFLRLAPHYAALAWASR